jgi:hypothetical protein
MWISKVMFEELQTRNKVDFERATALSLDVMRLATENAALKAEVTRHIADKDWFKHRLNQVEMERAQLIYAATGGSGGGRFAVADREGVKVMAPQFIMGAPKAPAMSETLNEQYNPFGTVGEDSNEPSDQIPGASSEDLTHLPGYKG